MSWTLIFRGTTIDICFHLLTVKINKIIFYWFGNHTNLQSVSSLRRRRRFAIFLLFINNNPIVGCVPIIECITHQLIDELLATGGLGPFIFVIITIVVVVSIWLPGWTNLLSEHNDSCHCSVENFLPYLYIPQYCVNCSSSNNIRLCSICNILHPCYSEELLFLLFGFLLLS
jgi:hypothetical protein